MKRVAPFGFDTVPIKTVRNNMMKKKLLMVVVALMATMSMVAQKVVVVDANGRGIPLVSVLTEDGNLIGTTDLNGVIADVKGAAKVAITHVAYKPQVVTMASLTGGRVTMEDLDYDLQEIVVVPKPYIYVETFYRVYVYRNDSLCYFLSGIMPNAYDPERKKREHGSYYHACGEFSSKMGAAITWGARAQEHHAGLVPINGVPEKTMKEKYYTTISEETPNHKTYSNPQGVVGQFDRTNGQTHVTLDGSKMQMYANEVKGETKVLNKRKEMGYEYQYTLIFDNDEGHDLDVTTFMMESNHWEYTDKKSHVKYIIETYATDHYYMDKQEWKDKKKDIKENYSSMMTLKQLEEYERQHNIPALSSATRQAIDKLKAY